MAEETSKFKNYTALLSTLFIISQHGRKLDPNAIWNDNQDITDENFDLSKIDGILKSFNFKSEEIHCTFEELKNVPLPALIRFKNGNYSVLGVNNDETVYVINALTSVPIAISSEKFREVWNGKVYMIRPRLTVSEFAKRFNLEWFLEIIIHYKKYFIEVLAATFFVQLMGLLMPLFTQVVVDKVIGNSGLSTLTVLGVSMLIMILVGNALTGVKTYVMNYTTNKLDAILGTRLFRHLISLPANYYEHRKVGETMFRINSLTGIREFLTGRSLTTVLDVVFSVVFVAVMFYYSVYLTLIALVIVPLFLGQAFLAFPIFWKKVQISNNANMVRRAFLTEAVTGMQTVKALAVEPQFIKKWEKFVARHVSLAFDLLRFNLIVTSGNELIQSISKLLILWFGGYMVMTGEFTLGQLIAFQMISAQAIGPLTTLLTMWPEVQQAGMGLVMLGDIIHSKREPVLDPVPPGLPALRGDIEVNHLYFRYRPDLPFALEDVSFSIKAGEKIGIVGRSGSGKSTLASLLQKIYFQDDGNITVDGIDLRNADFQWLRRQMGVVMQDNYLFDGSIRDNIAAGFPAAPMNMVIDAAKIAGAHEFILELDEGYDTKVGERGAGLSGGQRQRVAIARALLTNPKILIFDEATSALDYESERVVMKNLENIAGERTMIIIAHRLVTVEKCDKIIVLDHGKIAEMGSHDELLAQGGIYAKLYEIQGVKK